MIGLNKWIGNELEPKKSSTDEKRKHELHCNYKIWFKEESIKLSKEVYVNDDKSTTHMKI